MRLRAIVVVTSLALAPAAASAEEVTLTLGNRGVRIPVGPAGTVYAVERYVVQGSRYAVIRSRGPGNPSRCEVPSARVSAWTYTQTTALELYNEVFDRCPSRAGGPPKQVTTSVELSGDLPELRVTVLDPRMLPEYAPVQRMRRIGDRFVSLRESAVLATAPGESPQRALPEAPEGTTDGDAGEWQGLEPWTRGDDAALWVGLRGSTLRFAARVPSREAARAELTVTLGEPGVSTGTLLGELDNHGRVVTVRCGEAPSEDGYSVARCVRHGDTTVLEGETDLATMVWSTSAIRSVGLHAGLRAGRVRLAAESGRRQRVYALSSPVELLAGASALALNTCSRGYIARLPPSLVEIAGVTEMLTCGSTCRAGRCGTSVVASGLGDRLEWVTRGAGAPPCLSALGAGAEEFPRCDLSDGPRLVGVVPARGYNLVAVLERDVEGGQHRAEVWALVTRSARWQRVWQGEEAPGGLTEVRLTGLHPQVCRAERCEVIDAVTFSPPEDPVATARVMRVLRSAGLVARREAAR